VLLAVYYILLEKNKMHGFNRFYLLLSIVAGLMLPVLTIKIPSGAFKHTPLLSKTIVIDQVQEPFPAGVKESVTVQQSPSLYNWDTLWLVTYALITGVLVARFAANLIKIRLLIFKNQRIKLSDASLVLLTDDVVPHSFLGYVFLNENEYKHGHVEPQLLKHELTHVRQMHSLDILFIEMLKILFWFNPLFIFYKKAIQLNHEFLADEAVLYTCEVSKYQYLLLERSIITPVIPLTSNLNYSLTKKRLTMMTKTTSDLKIWTTRLAIVPVLAALLFLFSMKSVSEEKKMKPKASDDHARITAYPDRETFFKDAAIWIENNEGKYISKKYNDMSAAEKAKLTAPLLPKNTVTKQDLSAWEKQPLIYTICIDNKYAENSELAKYKPEDFVLYSIRKPGKIDIAVNKNYGNAPHLVSLHTMKSYEPMFIKPYMQPGKWLAVFQGKIWPGGCDGAALIQKYFEVEELKKANPNYDRRWLLPPFKPERIAEK
jgi:hypothetical protein